MCTHTCAPENYLPIGLHPEASQQSLIRTATEFEKYDRYQLSDFLCLDCRKGEAHLAAPAALDRPVDATERIEVSRLSCMQPPRRLP